MKTVISGSDKVVILFGTYGLPALQLTPCDVVMIKNFTLGPSVVLGVIYNFILFFRCISFSDFSHKKSRYSRQYRLFLSTIAG